MAKEKKRARSLARRRGRARQPSKKGVVGNVLKVRRSSLQKGNGEHNSSGGKKGLPDLMGVFSRSPARGNWPDQKVIKPHPGGKEGGTAKGKKKRRLPASLKEEKKKFQMYAWSGNNIETPREE